jgi:folate-binding protein YgfZ
VIAISGADAIAFLQGQLSIDVGALPDDRWRYASFNTPQGRVYATLALWREGDGYRALVPVDVAAAFCRRLSMYVLRSKVAIADLGGQVARIGVGGPQAAAVLASGGAPVVAGGSVARDGDATFLGFAGQGVVVLAPPARIEALAAAFAAHAVRAPFAVWEWLAIRAGAVAVGAAIQDRFVAQMLNLDLLGGIDFEKGCYTGQEIVARTHYLGRLKERTAGFHCDSPAAAGDRLYSVAFPGQACGTVVAAASAPGGGVELLAVVQSAALAADDLALGAVDGPALTRFALPYALPRADAPRVERPRLR